jgi:cell division protein FtsN
MAESFDSDQIRVFDGSEDDDEAEGSRLPVLIVIALVVLASFAGVVWLAYQKGVASGRSEPRVVVADTDNQNSSPATNTGNPTEYKGLKIYEQPAPNDADQGSAPTTATATPPTAPTTTPKVEQPTSPPLRAPVTEATDNSAVAPKAAALPPPAPVKPKPEKKVAVVIPSEASAPPPSLAPDTTAAPAPTHAASTGGYVLQIGSYKSTREAVAAWASDKVKHAGVLSGYSPDVKKVDLGDKGTWYRLRIASFADKSAANDLCDKLKADGGSCFLAK